MSHFLSTVNPEAAAAADSGWQPAGPPLADGDLAPALPELPEWVDPPLPRDIPSVGNIVVYHLRDGDSRNRRVKFPAIVMDGDRETGTLKLWVIVDDGDTWMQDRVPARVAPEPGWELVQHMNASPPWHLDSRGPTVSLNENSPGAPGYASWVPGDGPDMTVLIADLSARIAALEAKRGPGRPKGS